MNLSNVLVDEDLFPRFSWTVGPEVRTSLFDPDEPLRAHASRAGWLIWETRNV